MGARKRVRRFLRWWSKDGTHPQEYIAWSGSQHLPEFPAVSDQLFQVLDGQHLSDFRELEVENEKLNERILQLEQATAPELPELDTEPLEGVEESVGGGPIVLSKDQYNQLVRYSKRQTHTDPQGTRWEWIRAGERTGYAARIDELRSELETVKTELEKARENISQWNGAEERWTAKETRLRERLEAAQGSMRRESDAWLAIPLVFRDTDGLPAAVQRLVDDRRECVDMLEQINALIPNGYSGTIIEKIKAWTGNYIKRIDQQNETIQRLRDQEQALRHKLRDAQGRVAPEVNGNGPDGATRLQRLVETYRSHNNIGPGAIRSTAIKEEALTITLYVNDIEATLRQLNEARSMADDYKRRNEAAFNALASRDE